MRLGEISVVGLSGELTNESGVWIYPVGQQKVSEFTEKTPVTWRIIFTS